jgi:hypothetical protein
MVYYATRNESVGLSHERSNDNHSTRKQTSLEGLGSFVTFVTFVRSSLSLSSICI